MERKNSFDIDFAAAAAAGAAGNMLLGASSIYWKLLSDVTPTTLLAYRIILSLLVLTVIMGALGRLPKLRSEWTRRHAVIHFLAAILVAINWGTFIWASIHGHVVESGLGYLIAPFITIAFGILLFGDRLTPARRWSFSAIALAVLFLITRSGELLHWIYFTIAASWGAYACLKKISRLDPFSGLFWETLFLSLGLVIFMPLSIAELTLPVEFSWVDAVTLAVCGIVSVLPLWLFSFAATHLPLPVMGGLQFILPMTQLVVALAYYHQTVSINTLVSFGVIWLSLTSLVAMPLIVKKGAHRETL